MLRRLPEHVMHLSCLFEQQVLWLGAQQGDQWKWTVVSSLREQLGHAMQLGLHTYELR